MGRISLKRVAFDEIPAVRASDPEAEAEAGRILADIRQGGEKALRHWAERLGELGPGEPLYLDRTELERARDSLGPSRRNLLEAAHERIRAFAAAQRACLSDLDFPVPGGRAGHRFVPVERAGCYVPGGRFPLASSALMTVAAARAAGVGSVWCAGPHPAAETLASAAIAGAEGFLAVGGAQAIGALAYGCGPIAPRDVIAGPGGRFVAAAKRLLFGLVGTEAPAGPSELLVIADKGADPGLVAADLLAQAEHDIAAIPALIALEESIVGRVEEALAGLAESLPERNAATARGALANGWVFVAASPEEACAASDRFAPEHLELLVSEPRRFSARIRNAGAIFLGPASAEVFGDYGSGPNHCLPTGGAARFAAGLSVLTFLRARTWLEIEDPEVPAAQAAQFARLEGLEAHARAAEARAKPR
jgi:phosphoribosyl-ATP pyrophosphohydrolase/phosphoribosyl-AMP cyclohydrolase/histidinol dehydrogenase